MRKNHRGFGGCCAIQELETVNGSTYPKMAPPCQLSFFAVQFFAAAIIKVRAAIGLYVWFYLSGLAILTGGEINFLLGEPQNSAIVHPRA
jgi:hypothetical protein